MAELNTDIIDFDIDELADMPSFDIPSGIYVWEGVSLGQSRPVESPDDTGVNLTIKLVESPDDTVVNLTIKLVGIKQLKDPNDIPPRIGADFKFNWPLVVKNRDGEEVQFGTESNQGQIKMVTRALGAALNTGKSFAALAEKFPGVQFTSVMHLRKYKDKTTGEERTQNQFKSVYVE